MKKSLITVSYPCMPEDILHVDSFSLDKITLFHFGKNTFFRKVVGTIYAVSHTAESVMVELL